jgi:hypothetical protein
MLPDAAPRLCLQGSAACAVAAFFRLRHLLAGRNVVVLCCGGNVALPTLKQVCPPLPRALLRCCLCKAQDATPMPHPHMLD